MVGYLRGATAEIRPVQDLVASLPFVTGAPPRYFVFGRTVRPLPAAEAVSLSTEAPYSCAPGQTPCDNQESRLDAVLRAVQASPKDRVSVVLTDMWLSNSEMAASGPVALATPLAEMFGQGRSVGLIGLRAPYRGTIYDLPDGSTYNGATARPLFLLVIGPVEAVEAFQQRLAQSGGGAFGADRTSYSLFTAVPTRLSAPAAHPLKVTNGAALREQVVLPVGATPPVQQLRLERVAVQKTRMGSPTAGTGQGVFTADLRTAVRPGAVWTGPISESVQVWRLKSPKTPCKPGAWTPFGTLEGAWSRSAAGSGTESWRFTLDPVSASARLPPGRQYLIAGSLKRAGLQSPNPANDWLRQWSFNASSAPRVVASRPAFFPTLNLAETATILEGALDQAARRGGGEVAGFAAVVDSAG